MRAALIALLLIATPAMAAEPTVLTLGESAERAVPQDKLFVSLRAEATAPTAAAVQAEINKRMDAAIARAKTAPGVEIETGGYWTGEERPHGQPRRWRGAAALEISGADFASVTALAGGLQETGLAMSGMRFDLRRETARSVEDALTREALARLQARAASAADALNMKVAGYRAIRVGAVNEQPPMRPAMMRVAPAMAAADAAPAPSAEPGRATVRVSVEADVLLEAK